MKTEQEQIEDIIKILLDASKKCFDADCDCCEKQYEKDCAQYNKAKALVQAGYGDVSEYKKALYNAQRNQRNIEELEVLAFDSERLVQRTNEENDKLKSEIKQLQTEKRILADGFNDLHAENYQLKQEIEKLKSVKNSHYDKDTTEEDEQLKAKIKELYAIDRQLFLKKINSVFKDTSPSAKKDLLNFQVEMAQRQAHIRDLESRLLQHYLNKQARDFSMERYEKNLLYWIK